MNLITYKIFLTVLEARNLKSVLLSIVKVLAGSIPSRFSEEESVSFHFVAWKPLGFLGSRPILESLQHLTSTTMAPSSPGIRYLSDSVL